MAKYFAFILAISFIVFGLGCATVYQSKMVAKPLIKVESKVEKKYKGVRFHFKSRKRVFGLLMSQAKNAQQTPYPELAQTMSKMTQAFEGVRQSRGQIIDSINGVKSVTQAKKVVEADSEDGQTLKKNHDDLKLRIEGMQKAMTEYKAHAESFDALIKAHRIGEVHVDQYLQRLESRLVRFEERANQVEAQILKAKTQLSRLTGAEQKEKQHALKKMQSLVGESKKHLKDTRISMAELKKEMGAKKVLFIGPDSPKSPSWQDLQVKTSKLKDLANSYKAASKKLSQ